MQMLTSRQHRLLRFLLQQQEYITLLNIAAWLDVSEKTVQRDLRLINEYIAEWHVFTDKKAGVGVMLVAENAADILQLEQQLNVDSDDGSGMMGHARRVKIASQLLSETPRETSINKLSERYFISNASIVNDLKVIEGWITPLGLQLIRSQSGTRIEGSENSVRQAMAALINGVMNHQEPGVVNHSRIDPGSYKALVQYFGEQDVDFVQTLLKEMEQALSYPLGEPYYINIFTHILIMMHRLTRGNLLSRIEIDEQHHMDERVISVAREMIAKIEIWMDKKLPEDEVFFIYQYIISSGILLEEKQENSYYHARFFSHEARDVTLHLIDVFSALVDLPLSHDEQLYDGLIVHIRPLINRLNYRINIRNPLLDDIKNELPDIYQLTVVAVEKVFSTGSPKSVTEDEIGYLAVHFQAAIERQIAHKHILLVCSTGVGTSHLLKSRILRAFPDWVIAGVVSAGNMAKFCQQENVDLIISTVQLPEARIPVVYVTAFFNDADIKRVTEKVITEKTQQARALLSVIGN